MNITTDKIQHAVNSKCTCTIKLEITNKIVEPKI